MKELELTRTAHDRRLYTLEGVGTIRLEGMFSNSATAHAGDETWRITRRGPGRYIGNRIGMRGKCTTCQFSARYRDSNAMP